MRCKTYSVAKIISSNFTLSIKSLKNGKLVSLFFYNFSIVFKELNIHFWQGCLESFTWKTEKNKLHQYYIILEPNSHRLFISQPISISKNHLVILKIYFFQVPQRISLPASHLLNSLASTVRPSFMTVLDNVQKLFHDVSSGALSEMPLEVLFIL